MEAPAQVGTASVARRDGEYRVEALGCEGDTGIDESKVDDQLAINRAFLRGKYLCCCCPLSMLEDKEDVRKLYAKYPERLPLAAFAVNARTGERVGFIHLYAHRPGSTRHRPNIQAPSLSRLRLTLPPIARPI